MIFLKFLLHIFIFFLLTIVTQIGGVIYLFSVFLVKKNSEKKVIKRFLYFSIIYLIATFLVVPNVSSYFGREKIKDSSVLQAHSFFYKLANRNYVKPELNTVISKIAIDFSNKNKGIKLIYLDANFPFFDKFPLLPHLSHNDGKKIDISFVYAENERLSNKKPSISGYGVYENPTAKEFNQTEFCKEKGYWQYDFPKYLTLVTINKDITFSNKANRDLVNLIVNQKEVGKIFIEPHLKNRLNLSSSKIRFHGCGAVRHDDHIHFQLK
ncbi:hypothetical protein LPB136_13205 [Tenacibaculum todarodis]|uniref:Uncharacterized protein n=1 Tax=Tenacibaculum todarodis TaxID=1850252 RepID=A0A1L3JMF5_9FLAO|nr:hypothetical protein [Tenacibaculum todarodis]APG66272.1 hypothetical protein LPB136_13205 [Tenacibaculum todarodis]